MGSKPELNKSIGAWAWAVNGNPATRRSANAAARPVTVQAAALLAISGDAAGKRCLRIERHESLLGEEGTS